ncbi:DNA-3-methyladenine glycosylase [Ornithinicoccus hortensis]|uniref:Putative 3-methyladenine DNA glycosylase n=1 Tax=Ornithinicoccus hortensis TaxID=82346 RepID=A0A542YSC0_9MICO|nr:DNA-3-methyladenine glycosylase [Ornithinicoccus hortensis]TQL50989.1 DNA-3-methyladenine glycosylase [Ornithinicoccus hortensis]
MTPAPDRPRLDRAFLARPELEVAPDLLGCTIWHGSVGIRLTEVEAYAGARDPGSHSYRGRTPRNAVMFGPAGHLYCYFTYGMHHCLNVVCGPEGESSAVLLRAGEVVSGEALVRERRSGTKGPPAFRDLARGPARLCRALGLDLAADGTDLCAPGAPVWLEPGPDRGSGGDRREGNGADRIRTGPRVGLRGPGGDGTAYPWRFWLADEPTVSPYRPAAPPRRRTGH